MLEPHDTPQADRRPPADPALAHCTKDALAQVHSTGRDLQDARATKDLLQIAEAQHRLRRAVDDARDVGVLWGAIGDALGITRGNAYQRYRRPPPPHH